MLLSNNMPDPRYGGQTSGMLEPINKKALPSTPEIDLAPYQQRWSLMRLEVFTKWYQHWRDLSRYINPKRGWFEGFVPNYNGQYDYRLVMDGDPAQYARVLSAGMTSGLTSPSRPWFRLALEYPLIEKSASVDLWLEDVERTIMSVFSKSNVYDAFQHCYEELGLFGTGAFGIYEDYDHVIRARSYTVGEYYLGTGHDSRVNSFARQYYQTVDQLVEEYGWENCSDKTKAMYQAGNRDQFVLVYELVEPNTTRVPGLENFQGKKFRSIRWEAQNNNNKALKISGYNEFPIMAPVWDTVTTADIYGIGPGWHSLGDIKELYRLTKDLLLITNKIGDPPVVLDASVEGQGNMLPGGITRSTSTTSNAGIRPAYQIQGDPVSPLRLRIQEKKQQIASRFYADLFMMMLNNEQSNMTAREVAEKSSEKLLLLGPVLNRVQCNMLNPAIERTFAICLRKGLIPPPPPEIQGQPLKVEYISILAQAQKIAEVQQIDAMSSYVANLAPVFPTIVDNFDQDEAVRERAEMLGTPKRIIRSKDDIAAIRQQRAQQQAATEQQAAMAQAAEMAQKLSQTPVGDRNALEHLTNTEPAQEGM